MERQIYVDINHQEARVALMEDGQLAELHIETSGHERLVGNIYKGRVENILPGMQAAFINIGLPRNAFLYAGDILVDKGDFDFGSDNGVFDHSIGVPNIRDLLRPGQEILVQVLKQPEGTKGARVTTHITLPGKDIVLLPTVDNVGVSRRIVDESERERLKETVCRVKPDGMGVIVRTAAEGSSERDLADAIGFQARLWEKIRSKADFTGAPHLIHAEEPLLFRTIRDLFSKDVTSFIINDHDYYTKLRALAAITHPQLADRVHLYEGAGNLFDAYEIEAKIERALQRKVWVKNGCYLVIDEAEALTVIDVNTGKFTGSNDLQNTILEANIEAAREIARQLRLRNISGIIVIDFIDMDSEENREKLLLELRRALAKDRTKSTVLGITGLGLVEMTRKKVSRKLSSVTQTTCPYCGGIGRVYTEQSMAMRVRRDVVRAVEQHKARRYLVEVAPPVARYIKTKNNANEVILPSMPGSTFFLYENPSFHIHDIRITPETGQQDSAKLKQSTVFC